MYVLDFGSICGTILFWFLIGSYLHFKHLGSWKMLKMNTKYFNSLGLGANWLCIVHSLNGLNKHGS